MHLYAGKNYHYAKQGRKTANNFMALVTECIEKDRAMHIGFSTFKNGKWKGMELEQHIGFVKWNDDNYRYPLRVQVEPAHKPRMSVTRKDREEVFSKNYGSPMTITIDDFLYPGNDEVILEIANDGIGSLDYVIEPEREYDWLNISKMKGTVESQEEIILRCNRKNLTDEIQNARLLIKDQETTVAVEIKAKNPVTKNLPPMTFLGNNGVIVIEANRFYGKKDVAAGRFIELKNYGRSGVGMKVFPTTCCFTEHDDVPALNYRFFIEEEDKYTAEVWTTPTNPVHNKNSLRFRFNSSQGKQIITAVPSDFMAGNPSDPRWCDGVLNNIRVSKIPLILEEGVQEISIGALEAALVLEKVLIYKEGREPLESYLGPPSSCPGPIP